MGEPLDLPVGETGTVRAGPAGLEAVLKFEIFATKKQIFILAGLFLSPVKPSKVSTVKIVLNFGSHWHDRLFHLCSALQNFSEMISWKLWRNQPIFSQSPIIV